MWFGSFEGVTHVNAVDLPIRARAVGEIPGVAAAIGPYNPVVSGS
jgi:hypothetical protein